MKIQSNENYIELDVSLEEDESLPSCGDVYLSISASSHGFSGKNDLWVQAEEFRRFCAELVKLEKERKGEATLKSISPGELYLKVYAIDSLGHIAISGNTGYEIDNIEHNVTFGFQIEPNALEKMVRASWVRETIA